MARYDDFDVDVSSSGLHPVNEENNEDGEWGSGEDEGSLIEDVDDDFSDDGYGDLCSPFRSVMRPSSARPAGRPASSLSRGDRAAPSRAKTTRPGSAPSSRARSSAAVTRSSSRQSTRPTTRIAFGEGPSKRRSPLRGGGTRPKAAAMRQPSSQRTFFQDPEAMQFEISTLKKKVQELEEERTMTRSKSQRMEAEVGRKERQIESLLSAKGSLDRGESKSVHLDKLRSETKLIASLKNKNKLLAKKMKDQEAKLESFKNDSRYTRLAEKEMESQTYYKESVRLRDLLEERAQAQDDVEQAQAHEKELIRDMREKIKFLKEENRELKRDARALVEKTAEWEEENRYLTQELTQAQRKLSVLPRKQRQALDDASSETQELKIAHEKALVELEMQEITHTEEIKDLLAAKRAAEMQLKRQREEFANGGGETGSSQQDYWEKRTEAAKEEFERKLAHETSEMRYQFKEVQAKLQRAEKELVYWRSQGTQPPRSGTDSAAAAAPVAADQGHGPGTSPAKSRKSPSASPSGQRAVPTKSPGDCYVSSPEAADHSLRFSDDDHDDVGAHRRYSFGEEEEEEVPLEQDIYDERQHPPRPASRHGRMDENNDANYDSDDSEHARACAEAAAAAAEAARAAAVAADSDVDEDSEIDEVVDDF